MRVAVDVSAKRRFNEEPARSCCWIPNDQRRTITRKRHRSRRPTRFVSFFFTVASEVSFFKLLSRTIAAGFFPDDDRFYAFMRCDHYPSKWQTISRADPPQQKRALMENVFVGVDGVLLSFFLVEENNRHAKIIVLLIRCI